MSANPGTIAARASGARPTSSTRRCNGSDGGRNGMYRASAHRESRESGRWTIFAGEKLSPTPARGALDGPGGQQLVVARDRAAACGCAELRQDVGDVAADGL